LRRHADLPDLPLLTEIAQNEADRELLHFISADVSIARAAWIPTPPGNAISLARPTARA
jgi:hypothetical protein